MKKYEDVDSYIAGSAEDARPKLEELRSLIKSTIPKVNESISWGVPFYKYHGLLAGLATYENHISLGLATVLLTKDREILEQKSYKTGVKTIQIKFDQNVPAAEIKRMLKSVAKLNETVK